MALVSEVRDHIKDDLTITGTDYDTQIVRAIQSALRQYRGKRYWFLRAYDTISTVVDSESVALPSDFSAPESFELIYQNQRYSDGKGFDLLEFDRLKADYWTPLQSGHPQACAVMGNLLYLSRQADAVYSIPLTYYKQDLNMPAADETSIWLDDGYDVIRAAAQFIFKRNTQGMTLTEADSDMVDMAVENLNNAHAARQVGRA